MKIVSYSDLHLEFKHGWQLPADLDADVLLLAGDIILFSDFTPLKALLQNWHKPVLFVAGNHEYYTNVPMQRNNEQFREWLRNELPQVSFLLNEHICIDGVNFFGGGMWTDFKAGNAASMEYASRHMNDFKYIYDNGAFTPEKSIVHHHEFIKALVAWFERSFTGPHVVITHHAPVENQQSKHLNSKLQPAFIAYDMLDIINKYAPELWVYGHSHECDKQQLGKTKIIANQLGYPDDYGQYECSTSFDEYGCAINIQLSVHMVTQ